MTHNDRQEKVQRLAHQLRAGTYTEDRMLIAGRIVDHAEALATGLGCRVRIIPPDRYLRGKHQ